jgi:hypothetical protein
MSMILYTNTKSYLHTTLSPHLLELPTQIPRQQVLALCTHTTPRQRIFFISGESRLLLQHFAHR